MSNSLAALALLAITSAHAAMWDDYFLTTPTQIADIGFDVARHPDGRTFMARFENVDAGSPNLYLAQKPGPDSPWTEEGIRNMALFDVRSLDLSVDDDGGLHLAFITEGFLLGTIVNLNYGYQTPGGDWVFEVIGEADPDTDEKSDYAISLDLDSSGLPGIAYIADNAALGFVRQAPDGSWQDTLVSAARNSGYRPSLKFFANPDEPIGISHYTQGTADLIFSSFQSGANLWSSEVVANNSRHSSALNEVAGTNPAIAFRSDFPHEAINHLVRKDGIWIASVVDQPFPREEDNALFGSQFSLTVDARQLPQITYFKGCHHDGVTRLEEIRHARQLPNGLWANEVCVTFPEAPVHEFYDFQLSADVDSLGNPLAVYTNAPVGNNVHLRFTRPRGPIWTATDLSEGFPGGNLISAPSLAFGPDGTRVVSAGIERGDTSYLAHWIKPVEAEEFTHLSFVESNLFATETVLGAEGRIDSIVSYPSGRFVNFSTQIQEGATLVAHETDVLFSNRHLSDLAIDHLGYRHLILEGNDGLEYFRAAPPLPFEPPVWENQTDQTTLNNGSDPSIAISSGNKLAFAWTKVIEGDHYLSATYQKDNQQQGSFHFINNPPPRNPSLAWLNDDPYLIFTTYYFDGNRSLIKIRNLKTEEEFNFNVDGVISEMETVANNDTLHVAWRSHHIFQGPGEPTHSGSRYLGYLAIGACPGNPQVVGALPYLDPQDGFARIDNVDLALDPQGRPYILANLRSDEGPDSLFLFEPAGNHGASPGDEIAFPSGLQQELVFTEEGRPVHEVSFLHPSGQLPTIPPGSGYLTLGAITLHSHFSQDLENETPTPEVIHLSTIAQPGAPDLERSTYQFSAGEQADIPRLFYRLSLKRSCAVIQR
ncbi:hypothetical protein N9Z83_02210 [Akkermansiaceae bacterium]|nr:hypothetical protein [Akkermansiaceae bacterium]